MRRTYKFRLYPNVNQERELGSQVETLRRIYNSALEQRKTAYENEGLTFRLAEQYPVFAAERNRQITDQKAGSPGPFWYAHVSAVSMRDTIKRLDKAFDAFFRRVQEGTGKVGYPRFKSRDRFDSIPFDNYGNGCTLIGPNGRPIFGNMTDDIDLHGHRLRLFGVGSIRVKLHRSIKGTIKTVTVKREADCWFVTFSCDLGDVKIEPSMLPPVGIDVGLEHFLTTSAGEHSPNPRYLKHELPEVRRLARKIALHDGQKKKAKRDYPKRGSRHRNKAKKSLQRLHARVRNLRKEHHYQEALKLVRRYGVICVESLNIQGMLKNDKLARSIGDAGWYGFTAILEHKAEEAGARVIEVDPRGTSQECSGCGREVRKDLRVRQHDCPHCGLSLQRDHNAARNILQRGLRQARIGLAPLNVAPKGKRAARSTAQRSQKSRRERGPAPASAAKAPRTASRETVGKARRGKQL